MLSWKQILGLVAVPAVFALLIALQPFSGDDDEGQETASAAECRGLEANAQACEVKELEQAVAKDGPRNVTAEIKDRLAADEIDSANCHQLMHAVGRAAALRYRDVGVAFLNGDQVCGAGYYHGAMEGILQVLGSRTKVAREIPGLCTEPRKSGRYAIEHYSCAHGLGHGLLGTSGTVPAALRGCDRLRDSREQRYCSSGVFMENTRPHAGTAKLVAANRLREICPKLDGAYQSVCYQRLAQDEAVAADSEFRSIVALCEKVDGEFTVDCYKGVGALAANIGSENAGADSDGYGLAAGLCGLGKTPDGVAACFVAAAATFVYNERGMNGAQAVCGAAPRGVRELCLRVAAERMQTLYSS
jgi:hypothetical protein